MNDAAQGPSGPNIAAYPLCWPADWPRTPAGQRTRSRYEVNQTTAVNGIERAVRILGGRDLIISTNVHSNSRGRPSIDAVVPRDPGAAVYWVRKGRPQVIACDRHPQLWENLRAIGLALDALRALERSGATQVIERAFMGLRALPANAARHWRLVLELPDVADLPTIEAAYSRLAQQRHPDKQGGSHEAMVELNRAYREAIEAVRGGEL